MRGSMIGLISIACSLLISSCGASDGELSDEYNAVGRATFAAACANVIRDSEANKVRIFAAVATKPIVKNFDGFEVELIVNKNIITNHRKFSAAYHNHHNSIVLEFAATQILNGDRDLGINLIQLLSEADPSFEWSSPIHGNRTIQQILKGLKADDGSMNDFLKSGKNQWDWRKREYGTLSHPTKPIA